MTELQWLETNLLSLSPEMTAVLLGRIYAMAMQAILWGSIFYILGAYLSSVSARIYRRSKQDFDDYGFAWVIGAVTMFILATILMATAIGRLNAPEYYILRYIKDGLFSG